MRRRTQWMWLETKTSDINEDESRTAAQRESAMKRKALKLGLIWDLSGGFTALSSVISGSGKKVEAGGEAEEAGGRRRSVGEKKRRRVGVTFRNTSFLFPLTDFLDFLCLALCFKYSFLFFFSDAITLCH